MFENLEKIIRLSEANLTIMEERYGDGLLLGVDIPQSLAYLPQQPVHDLINQATSPGDVDAIEVVCVLAELEEKYPAFLYTQAATLKEGLEKIEERAKRWECLSHEEQEYILGTVNEVYSKIVISDVDYLLSQPYAYEVHYIKVSGDADTGSLLEVTTETDFQYNFELGQKLMVVTTDKNVFNGTLSFFNEESLTIKPNEEIDALIPFEIITHIIDCAMKEEAKECEEKN